MNWMRRAMKLSLVLGVFFLASTAHAGPVGCVAGYEDNTCLSSIVGSGPTKPVICTGAGQTVETPPQWQGSHWSSGACDSVAPPTCVAGYNETTAPTWNGASWVGEVCTPSAPPSPPGYTASPGGVYALILSYCGISFQATHGNTGAVTTQWLCSENFSTAGGRASGTNEGATTTYWNVPGGTSTESTAVERPFTQPAAPSGSIVQSGASAVVGTSESMWFACPVGYTLNVTEARAWISSNPFAIECNP
jgi:hypothetical protein